MVEGEVLFGEAAGDDVATVEGEFGVGAEKEVGAEADHGCERGETDGHADGAAEFAHERGLGDGVRCRGDVGALHGEVGESAFKKSIEIELVNPTHALGAGANTAAEPEAGERAECGEGAAAGTAVAADDETGAEDDAALGS